MADGRRQRELPYIKRQQLIWLAGLSEGEACFAAQKNNGCPVYTLAMTDKDVVEHVAKLIDASCRMYKPKKAHWSNYYVTRISGFKASQLFELLKPYMFERRKQKIEEILDSWKPKHRKLSSNEVDKIEALFSNEYTRIEITEILGVPYSAVQKVLQGRKADQWQEERMHDIEMSDVDTHLIWPTTTTTQADGNAT